MISRKRRQPDKVDYFESRTERKRMTGYLRAGGVKRTVSDGEDFPDTAAGKWRIALALLAALLLGIGLLSALL